MGDLTLDFQSVQKSIVDASVLHVYAENSTIFEPPLLSLSNLLSSTGFAVFVPPPPGNPDPR